jgi:hypothetical protein
MRSAEDIEKLVKRLNFKASADLHERTISDALRTQTKSKKKKSALARPTIWRIIMKSRITKLATAAVIILAVVISVTILDKSVTPAWAIEQTIETLREIESIHISGYFLTADAKKAGFQAWIIPSSEDSSRSAYYRFEAGRFKPGDFNPYDQNRHVAVVSEQDNSTYLYFPAGAWTFYPNQKIAYISEGLDRNPKDPPCLGSDFFEKMKEQAQDWHQEYGEDEETGRNSVFVTCTHPSRIGARFWWIQFDVETKLPVQYKLWWNQDYNAEPAASVNTITYNPKLPDGVFEFQVPEGTKVLDHRELSEMVGADPTLGINVNELDTEQACKRIASEYWEAVIAQNWQKVCRIRPLIEGQAWKQLQDMYISVKPAKLLGIRECFNLDNEASFPIVPCLIRMQNGMTEVGVLHASIEQVGDERRGVIVDSLGPEFVDPH